MALPKLFQVNEDSQSADVALLAIRLLAGLTLFVKSGAPKLFHLPTLLASNADSANLGVVAPAAELYAAFALGICTLLAAAGLATRYAAFFTAISLAGTGLLIDKALTLNYFDPGHNSHPEVVWLYMAAFIPLAIAGPGRFSLDRLFYKSSRSM